MEKGQALLTNTFLIVLMQKPRNISQYNMYVGILEGFNYILQIPRTILFAPRITTELGKAKAKKTFFIARQVVDHVCTKSTACTLHFLKTKVKYKKLISKKRTYIYEQLCCFQEECMCSVRSVQRKHQRKEFLGDEVEKENIFYFCFQDSTQDKQIEFIGLQCLVVDITLQKKFFFVQKKLYFFSKVGCVFVVSQL